MKSFRQFILAEGSGHLTHVEDSILYSGVDGARKAIQTLKSVRDSLTGKEKKPVSVTVKWDGAPAIFCGIDPADGKFFVAKKSIFNKVPEVYKTIADIDAAIAPGDLNVKMRVALAELSKLGIQGIIQGDIMFTADTVKRETIKGQEYVTFHPNTIVYAVPVDSEIGKKVSTAKIGVVFHTSYTGKLGSLEAVPGVNTKSMRQVPSVWWQTADLKSTQSPDVSAKDLSQIDGLLKQADQTLSKISPNALNAIEANPDLAQDLETYANSKVRAGQEIGDPKSHVIGLMNWMKARFDKEESEKKTAKGKAAVDLRRRARMEFFSRENMNNLILIFTLQQTLVDAKKLLISKLNQLGGVNTFLKTKSGYEKTGQEGYVVGDPMGGNTVKLVDRLGFSRANFSPDVVKGWDH
jgi:hypothetical protein